MSVLDPSLCLCSNYNFSHLLKVKVLLLHAPVCVCVCEIILVKSLAQRGVEACCECEELQRAELRVHVRAHECVFNPVYTDMGVCVCVCGNVACVFSALWVDVRQQLL